MIDSKITSMISSCRWKLKCYLDMLKICVYVNKFQTKHKFMSMFANIIMSYMVPWSTFYWLKSRGFFLTSLTWTT